MIVHLEETIKFALKVRALDWVCLRFAIQVFDTASQIGKVILKGYRGIIEPLEFVVVVRKSIGWIQVIWAATTILDGYIETVRTFIISSRFILINLLLIGLPIYLLDQVFVLVVQFATTWCSFTIIIISTVITRLSCHLHSFLLGQLRTLHKLFNSGHLFIALVFWKISWLWACRRTISAFKYVQVLLGENLLYHGSRLLLWWLMRGFSRLHCLKN